MPGGSRAHRRLELHAKTTSLSYGLRLLNKPALTMAYLLMCFLFCVLLLLCYIKTAESKYSVNLIAIIYYHDNNMFKCARLFSVDIGDSYKFSFCNGCPLFTILKISFLIFISIIISILFFFHYYTYYILDRYYYIIILDIFIHLPLTLFTIFRHIYMHGSILSVGALTVNKCICVYKMLDLESGHSMSVSKNCLLILKQKAR